MSSRPPLTDGPDRFGYEPIARTYHPQCLWDGDELCLSIVDAVATAIDREPRELEPFFSVLDPDALSALLDSSRDDEIQVSFSYEGCAVVVSSGGDLVVEPERDEG